MGLELHPSNEGMWGSRRQWAYGEVVSRLLAHFGVTNPGNDLHPVFAIMLNPAGGIAGYSNLSLLNGDMHTSVIVHAVVHDAYGYAGLFHNVGPGYNYLAINSMFSNDNCLSCQLHGILKTRGEMKQLGLLGDGGRKVRKDQMLLHRRQLTQSEYADGCLPAEEAIKSDYDSRIKVGFFRSFLGITKQLMINGRMKTWKV